MKILKSVALSLTIYPKAQGLASHHGVAVYLITALVRCISSAEGWIKQTVYKNYSPKYSPKNRQYAKGIFSDAFFIFNKTNIISKHVKYTLT